jgi:NitT/TauT family transport system substrate-binding protein
MRVGAHYWPGIFWIDIANEKEWFKEAGLNVEVVDTSPDYFGSYQDVVSGKLDVQSFALFDLLQQNARGADLVVVLVGDSSAGGEKIIGRPGINGLKDLKGKRVALIQGTYLEYIFEAATKQAGLNPASVQIVDVAGEKTPEALISGMVDAITAWESYAGQGLKAIKGNILFSTAQIPGLDPQVYALRREFIQKRPDEVRKFLRVWQQACEYIRKQPDEAFAIVAEVNGQTPQQVREFAALDKILDQRDNELAFSFTSGFDSLHGAAGKINAFMLDKAMTDKRLDSTRFRDPSFLREPDGR